MRSEFEHELMEYRLNMQVRCYGLIIAFQMPEKNNLRPPFNIEKGRELSLRKVELTLDARAESFYKTNVDKFINIYQVLIEKYHFAPNAIYNVD